MDSTTQLTGTDFTPELQPSFDLKIYHLVIFFGSNLIMFSMVMLHDVQNVPKLINI